MGEAKRRLTLMTDRKAKTWFMIATKNDLSYKYSEIEGDNKIEKEVVNIIYAPHGTKGGQVIPFTSYKEADEELTFMANEKVSEELTRYIKTLTFCILEVRHLPKKVMRLDQNWFNQNVVNETIVNLNSRMSSQLL